MSALSKHLTDFHKNPQGHCWSRLCWETTNEAKIGRNLSNKHVGRPHPKRRAQRRFQLWGKSVNAEESRDRTLEKVPSITPAILRAALQKATGFRGLDKVHLL